jgi:hypothetical protein
VEITTTPYPGDGLAFFIGPFPPTLPRSSTNQYLGLYTNPNILGSPPTVAVEFDTYWNSELDPPGVTDHVGIDINSLHSASYTTDLPNLGLYGRMLANITYDAGSKMMAVSLQLADGSNHRIQTSVDLIAAGLPQDAGVGFSASTGAYWESHHLLSWSFNSTDMVAGNELPKSLFFSRRVPIARVKEFLDSRFNCPMMTL